MYIPHAFRLSETEQLFDFIRSNGFAILVSSRTADEPPVATHLPLVLSENEGQTVLIGHFAKANPHWQVADQQPVLAIFHGPHSFISAAWYGRQNVVPTWNYVSVHVEGTLHVVKNRDRLRVIVHELTVTYEKPVGRATSEGPAWSMPSTDADFLDGMLNGIVGFEIEVTRMEGCWKLSQHHDAERRQRVITALRQRATGDDIEIANLMQQHSRQES